LNHLLTAAPRLTRGLRLTIGRLVSLQLRQHLLFNPQPI